ncbi:adenylate/guanylate cyclase domain-containing protein [Georgenia sp. Z1344]|uniref:adenylate/guanylate cyclase domain-containing protein n=1 Tax=Georgenia sp. Z1344 TaxID=3416706 RepID=UPI003CFB2FA9
MQRTPEGRPAVGPSDGGARVDPGAPELAESAAQAPAATSDSVESAAQVPAEAAIGPGTVDDRVRALIGSDAVYTIRELAEQAGTSLELAHTFWRAMGFPNVGETSVVFTDSDVAALRSMATQLDDGRIDMSTAISLLRAQSHTTDRLVLWQTEALVEGISRQRGIDDTSARRLFLDKVGDHTDVLEKQLSYAWRRQLAALLRRTEAEVASREPATAPGSAGSAERYPLTRALGFVDMVAYTRRSTELGSAALADLVQTFEYTSRDVITSAGARIVKTIGDAVLYVADDLVLAAEVCVDLIAALTAKERMLPVRASLVWGEVVSRFGDIFGPSVNLASRLVDVAPAGSVLMDSATADELSARDRVGEFRMVPLPAAGLEGIGQVSPVELVRATG